MPDTPKGLKMYADHERKKCKNCEQELHVNEFRKRTRPGKTKERITLESFCKKCEYITGKEYRKNNPDKYKKMEFTRKLFRKFKITEEVYYNMYKEQNYGCKVCKAKKSLSGRNLAVDHCHKTGKIRALLCNECNTSLGLLKEDINIIMALAEYIKVHEVEDKKPLR